MPTSELISLQTEIKSIISDIDDEEISEEHQILDRLKRVFKTSLKLEKLTITGILRLNLQKVVCPQDCIEALEDLRAIITEIRNGDIDLLDYRDKQNQLDQLNFRLGDLISTQKKFKKICKAESELNESLKYVLFDLESDLNAATSEYDVLQDLVKIYAETVEGNPDATMSTKQVMRHNLDNCDVLPEIVRDKLYKLRQIIKDIRSCTIDLESEDPSEKRVLITQLKKIEDMLPNDGDTPLKSAIHKKKNSPNRWWEEEKSMQ